MLAKQGVSATDPDVLYEQAQLQEHMQIEAKQVAAMDMFMKDPRAKKILDQKSDAGMSYRDIITPNLERMRGAQKG